MHCLASGRIYCPVGYIDREDSRGNVIPSDWRGHGNTLQSVRQIGSNMYSKSASEVRETLMNYFNSRAGSVPWQKNTLHQPNLIYYCYCHKMIILIVHNIIMLSFLL